MVSVNATDIHNILSEQLVSDEFLLVRSSAKAKRLIFKSSLKKGVEIVVPRGANLSWVAEMTKKQIPWIKCAQQWVRKGRSEINPIEIYLKALNEIWLVRYEPLREVSKGLIITGERSLVVGVDENDVFGVARKLQKWFQKKARAALIPWLTSFAEDRKLRINRVYVKNQTTRWGSCSEKRNINLNRNLLFLPTYLVEYVFHHELTHIDHLNHSPRFWSAFVSVIPNCRVLKFELDSLNPEDIPLWASPGQDNI